MLKLRTLLPCRRTVKTLSLTSTPNYFNASEFLKCNENVLKPHLSLVVVMHQRFYSNAIKKIKENASLNIKEQERIYYGTLAPRMKAVKVFSLLTSLVGFMAQPILMEEGSKLGGAGMAIFLCGFAGFFTIVTPLLLHFITKKYVTEMYYDPKSKEYTAVTISIILSTIYTKFRVEDVKVPEVPGMFTSFLVKDKPLFVDPALFENPDHYVKIMGYDKPIDFKLKLPLENKDKTPSELSKK